MKMRFEKAIDLWSPGMVSWARWTGARFTGFAIGKFIIGRVVNTK